MRGEAVDIRQVPGFEWDFSYLLPTGACIHSAPPVAWLHARDRDARAGAGEFFGVTGVATVRAYLPVMARRRRTKIDEATRTTWAEQAGAYIEKTAANPDRVAVRATPAKGTPQPSLGPGFVQMCTIQELPPSIALPLSTLQREMLWAGWHGELWLDGRGVSVAGRRASIVTLRALRHRGLVERGGGRVGITNAGEIALELLYTDPRQWSTPIEATTGTLTEE